MHHYIFSNWNINIRINNRLFVLQLLVVNSLLAMNLVALLFCRSTHRAEEMDFFKSQSLKSFTRLWQYGWC